jgi:nitrogen fixation NifU-like protein
MNTYKNELYQQVILDHNKHPKNFRKMENPTHCCPGNNPLCGDNFTLYLDISKDNIIEDVSFEGSGCAISKSSTSMLTTFLKGKHIDEIKERYREFHDLVTGENEGTQPDHKLGKLALFEGVKKYSARVKCATLPWHAIMGALDESEK